MDPTSSWVLALLCENTGWTYPSSQQSANSPPINPTPLNTTYPLPTVSSTMSHPTPTPTKPSAPLPWLSGPEPTPASCPDLISLAVYLAARLGLETPHPTFLTHPQKVTDKVGKTNSPLSVPPACYNPTLLISHRPPPCHPQRPSPCLLPAHTRGGSVCGRGGVCCRFWRWTSFG